MLETISFSVTFFLHSELKTVKLCSSGAGHGYWAHLRRGEANTDWGTRTQTLTHTLVFSAHLHTPTDITRSLSFLNALSFSLLKQLEGDPPSAVITKRFNWSQNVHFKKNKAKSAQGPWPPRKSSECQPVQMTGLYLNATPRSE